MVVFVEEISGKSTGSGGSWTYYSSSSNSTNANANTAVAGGLGYPGQPGSMSTSRGKRLAAGGDSSSRNRALTKRLNELERENYRDGVKIEVPKPQLVLDLKSGLTTNSRRVLGSRKTLTNHLDADVPSTQAFADAAAKPSQYPSRKICEICGYWGELTCLQCGAHYCSGSCRSTHLETRCMKSYS